MQINNKNDKFNLNFKKINELDLFKFMKKLLTIKEPIIWQCTWRLE